MTQYGFFYDQSRCYDCKACSVACKSWNGIEPGPVKWLRSFSWEEGTFPSTRLKALFAPCYHCEEPACVGACPNGALFKEDKYGAVLVDSEKCKGCRQCWEACPYGAPQFAGDGASTPMSKCTMCIDRLDKDMLPTCVASCPMRALDFGPVEDLRKKYGSLQQLEGMPAADLTNPSVVFKASAPRKELVPYDTNRVLELMADRGDLPSLYADVAAATQSGEGTVGRDRLCMKPRSAQQLMRATQNDEG